MIASAAGADGESVRNAFARVPRERFVAPGPWMVLAGDGYVASPSDDPALLYDDIVVALLPGKRINNGQPTLHARCLAAVRVKPGENALHIGCGSGYYTAVISELVGPSGAVDAWDIEPDLVAAASSNLQGRRGVTVALRDATAGSIPAHDLIYVCAGCTRPVRAWAEALADGGRLVFPLAPGWDRGAMLMVTRRGEDLDARFICRCGFIPCVGASIPTEASALRAAFARNDLDTVASLHFGDAPAHGDPWLAGDGWWLARKSTRPLH